MNFLLFNIISLLWTLYVRFPIVMIDFEMIWVLRDVTETNRDLRKNIKRDYNIFHAKICPGNDIFIML